MKMNEGGVAELGVLNAEIVGVAQLREMLGEGVADEALAGGLAFLCGVAAESGCRQVSRSDHGFVCLFEQVAPMFQCASRMQSELARYPAAGGIKLAARMGMEFGPVRQDGDAVAGEAADTAAQLVELAKAHQILAGQHAVDALPAPLARCVRALDPTAGGVLVPDAHEFLWRAAEALDLVSKPLAQRPAKGPVLRLKYRGRELLLDSGQEVFAIGRIGSSDLVLDDHRVSRLHARIERRGDDFVLVDESLNGTCVMVKGEKPVWVRGKDFTLHGEGGMRFGAANIGKDPDALVYFRCE